MLDRLKEFVLALKAAIDVTDRQIGRLALRAAADAVSVASDVAKKTIVLSAPIMRLRMVMAPLPRVE